MEDCRLKILLEDKPGELFQVLETIAKNRGNLFTVSHIREEMKDGRLPVIIGLQAQPDDFDSIVADLKSRGLEVLEKSIGGVEEKQLSRDVILIGHVIDSDMKDTIRKICNNEAIIKSLEISIRTLNEPSSAFIQIGARSPEALEKSMKKLKKLSKEKELMMITAIQS